MESYQWNHIYGITQYVHLGVWLLSCNIMAGEFIHVGQLCIPFRF